MISLLISEIKPAKSALDNRKYKIENPNSFDHFIRPRQHIRRNRQADLLGSFQIDNELELFWLLHRQIAGLGTFQNLVHVSSSAPEQVGQARAVGHKPAVFH